MLQLMSSRLSLTGCTKKGSDGTNGLIHTGFTSQEVLQDLPVSPKPWKFAGFPQLSWDRAEQEQQHSQDRHLGLRQVLPQGQESSARADSGPQHHSQTSLALTPRSYRNKPC